ncbi:MAG: hypothetical protein HYV35_07260 [Lentisphaerae bacterium]|nr:hypothetical protein [Lentisphaerota bacterium]
MATDKPLKSAFELAMEGLEKRAGTAAKLTDAQKAALAEVDRKTKARIAELEILGNDRLTKALDNPEKVEQIKAEQRLALEKARARAEEEKERIRRGKTQ